MFTHLAGKVSCEPVNVFFLTHKNIISAMVLRFKTFQTELPSDIHIWIITYVINTHGWSSVEEHCSLL